MVSTFEDVVDGVSTSTAVKSPVRCATTANITLSGFQAVGGVTLTSSDGNLRVLVKDQTDQTENGIYKARSGDWEREPDFDGPRDIRKGTLIPVIAGTHANNIFEVTAADPITVGTTSITFSAILATEKLSATSTTSLTIGTGSKTFTTQTGKYFEEDNYVLAVSDGSPGNYMIGQVTSYSSGSLTIDVEAVAGSGTFTDWNLFVSGPPGAAGNLGTFDPPDSTTTGGGTAGTDYTVSGWPTLTTGEVYTAAIHVANSGACNVASTSIKRREGIDPLPYDMRQGGIHSFKYDGTNLILQNPANRLSPDFMENISISASVASNDLTVALKTYDGGDPAATDPGLLGLRGRPVTDGGFEIISFTAAASVTLPATGTLSFANSEAGYIFVYLAYDGTNKEVGLTRLPLDEGVLHSTTAIGTGSDSVNVLYTTTGLTDAAVRLIGRIKITHGSSVWDSAPTEETAWFPTMGVTGQVAFELGGNFTAGESIRFVTTRIAGATRCDVFSTTAVAHTSGSSATSSAIIPSQFRPPTNDVSNAYLVGGDSLSVEVTTAGEISTSYIATSTGSGSTRANTGRPIFVTWFISD